MMWIWTWIWLGVLLRVRTITGAPLRQLASKKTCAQDEWLANKGTCDGEEARERDRLCVLLREQALSSYQQRNIKGSDPDSPGCIDDILLDINQLHEILPSENEHIRTKRKIRADFTVARWNKTIYYTIDKYLNPPLQVAVEEAIKMWEEKTCLDFVRLPDTDDTKEGEQPHLAFVVYYGLSCLSYIGRIPSYTRQPMYVGPNCDNSVHMAHEIGHALGIIHEHQRYDRDDYIEILQENIQPFYMSAFDLVTLNDATTLGLPYDYSSLMHYSGKASSIRGLDTMRARQLGYQGNMGQRTEISYMDALLVNRIYCSAECLAPLAQPCQYGGYQDPKNCGSCRCQDGRGGQYCQDDMASKGDPCGGIQSLTSSTTVETPEYTTGQANQPDQACSWLFTTSVPLSVHLRFTDWFEMTRTEEEVCVDWVELRVDTRLSYPAPSGMRLCGSTAPPERTFILQKDQQLAVVFRLSGSSPDQRRGFRLTLTPDALDLPCHGTGCGCNNIKGCESTTPHDATTGLPRMVIMIDTSDGFDSWNRLRISKSVAVDLLTKVTRDTAISAIAVGSFDHWGHKFLDYSSRSSIPTVIATIEALQPRYSQTNYFSAFDFVLDNFTEVPMASQGGHIQTVAIVVISSPHSASISSQKEDALREKLFDRGVQPVIVSLSAETNRDLLERIAGQPNVFKFSSNSVEFLSETISAYMNGTVNETTVLHQGISQPAEQLTTTSSSVFTQSISSSRSVTLTSSSTSQRPAPTSPVTTRSFNSATSIELRPTETSPFRNSLATSCHFQHLKCYYCLILFIILYHI